MRGSTDLTDRKWRIIEPIFKSKKGQQLVQHAKRDLINAVLYLVKTGCQWRMLPKDFPPPDTVWSFYRRAVKSGQWEKAMDLLVKQTQATPTYGLIDSQCAKTTVASEERGFDGGEKSKVVSAMWWWIPCVICWSPVFMLPIFMIQKQG